MLRANTDRKSHIGIGISVRQISQRCLCTKKTKQKKQFMEL